MSQNQALLAALKAGKHITAASALELFGIFRLSARIHDLRKLGHNIGDAWREGTTRFGKQMRYKEYFLVEV